MLTILISVLITQAQARPHYEKKEFTLAGQKIILEIADTDERRRHGLMFKRFMKENEGMIFYFDSEQRLAFWMRNTVIPLSIGFFDSAFKLVDIQEMEPASPMDVNPKTYEAKKPAKYAVEMNKGWFAKKKIPLGAKLEETKLRKASN